MTRIESEEELIGRFLAPLTRGAVEALGLNDDCALLTLKSGQELVLTTDAVAEGVHFFPDDAPEDIAWKALAVNASDLAGKAAEPSGYLMALSFPSAPETQWVARFAEGFGKAQDQLGMTLFGGDTDRRPGPLTVTITAIGLVPAGKLVRRATAQPGDLIFVSGTLGDAALGLQLRRNPGLVRTWGLDATTRDHLLRRYLRPQPRLGLRTALRECASAAMDISDGLAKDLGRMCKASGCGAEVDMRAVPLSQAARRATTSDAQILAPVVAGGDDYEILAAVPPQRKEQFTKLAASSQIEVTEIGKFLAAGTAVMFVGFDGQPVTAGGTGWDHFEQANIPSAR